MSELLFDELPSSDHVSPNTPPRRISKPDVKRSKEIRAVVESQLDLDGVLTDPGKLSKSPDLAELTLEQYKERSFLGNHVLEELNDAGLAKAKKKLLGDQAVPIVPGLSARECYIQELRQVFAQFSEDARAGGAAGAIRFSDAYFDALETARKSGRLSEQVSTSVAGIRAIPIHMTSLSEFVQISHLGKLADDLTRDELLETTRDIERNIGITNDRIRSSGWKITIETSLETREQQLALLKGYVLADAIEIQKSGEARHHSKVAAALRHGLIVPEKALRHYPDLLDIAHAKALIDLKTAGLPDTDFSEFAGCVSRVQVANYRSIYGDQGTKAVVNQTGEEVVIRKRLGENYLVKDDRDHVRQMAADSLTLGRSAGRGGFIIGSGLTALADLGSIYGPRCLVHQLAKIMLDQAMDVTDKPASEIAGIVESARSEVVRAGLRRNIASSEMNFIDHYSADELRAGVSKAVEIHGLKPMKGHELTF